MNAVNAMLQIAGGPVEVSEDLRQALEEMETAAWDAGVSPVEPLGVLYRSQRSVLTAFARLVTEQQRSVEETIRGSRQVVDAEIERLHKAQGVADATIQQLKAAGTATEADAEKVLAKVVEYVAPEIAGVLRDTVVVREHVHNKRLLLWHYLKGGTIALGLVLAGYSVHAWQTWGATSAIDYCRKNVVWNVAGQGFCAADRLFADPPQPPIQAQPQQGSPAAQGRVPAGSQPTR